MMLRFPLDLLAPQVGLEPTASKLTASCSAVELLRHMAGSVGFEPTSYGFGDRRVTITPETYMVRRRGLEPLTLWSVARCSIQLSQQRKFLVCLRRFELRTPALKGQCSTY